MLGWMKHKLESRLLGEIAITSDMRMTPYVRQKEKIRGKIPFTITTKRIKYLRINLPKETKDPYAEIKSLMTQTDGEIYHVLGLEESI